MIKTLDLGQFSYFSALPGVARGEHCHHTKIEKFLVVSGKARFRNIIDIAILRYLLQVASREWSGWADVTNIGEGNLIAIIWENESYRSNHPDTIPAKIDLEVVL